MLEKHRPIRSKKMRDAAKDQPCTLAIPGVCQGGTETTVACHIRDDHTGKGVKASDCSIADGCAACHDRLDGRSGTLSREDWEFYARRGMQRTLENRIRRGIVSLPQDAPKIPKRPIRKPQEQRAAIPQRADAWPPKGSRKIQSRNNLRRKSEEAE